MKKSNPTKKHPLTQYLTDFSYATSLWLSDAQFWKDEMIFCQETLEKNMVTFDTLEEKKRLEQLQNQLIMYRDELLDTLLHDLTLHQQQIETALKSKLKINPFTFQANHQKLKNEIGGFEKQLKTFKKELFDFAEQSK